jgi:nitrilase
LRTALIRGGSCIIDPIGEILFAPNFEENASRAEIDLRTIVRGKHDLDGVGHYAGPDISSLHVNEEPRTPVIFEQTAD